MTFSAGEASLNEWMSEHAKVCWHVMDEPWTAESRLLAEVDLPLNLDQNRHNAFHMHLTGVRQKSKAAARALSVLPR
jgi:hypothetical protein